jgi:hypothetical protein
MKKQTAVEWLVNEYAKAFKISVNAVMGETIEQAKAMEKEQIVDFAIKCQEMFKHQIEEEYNETYGGDK